MSLSGRIHSFETFGTVDGPGIRFVVFMQGCPLRCLYCHNRDTWDRTGGKEYSVDYVISLLKKYKNYIKISGGGLTVSGGEPLLQIKFVEELFKSSKREGIHNTLDTSGYADINDIDNVLDYTDLVLLDIKHGNACKHKLLTGVDNEKIREFTHRVSTRKIPIWFRYVLIPGYTDDVVDLKLASDFIKTINGVEKVEVLPYHKLGEFKWMELGKEYELADVSMPTEYSVKQAEEILMSGVRKL